MRPRILPALALLAVAGAAGHAQNQQPVPAGGCTPPPVAQAHDTSSQPSVAPPTQPPQVAVGDLPLDTLVKELESMQAQKAALAKREADVAKEVRRRLGLYSETLQKLGHGPAQQVTPFPPATTTSPPVIRRGVTPAEQLPRVRQSEPPAPPQLPPAY